MQALQVDTFASDGTFQADMLAWLGSPALLLHPDVGTRHAAARMHGELLDPSLRPMHPADWFAWFAEPRQFKFQSIRYGDTS